MRAALDPAAIRRRISALNPRRGHLIERDVEDSDLSPDERRELQSLEAEVSMLVALLTTPRRPDR